MANIHDIMTEDMAATAFDIDETISPSETVAYTAGAAAAKDVPAIVGPIGEDLEEIDDTTHKSEQAALIIPTDPTTGIETPMVGDTVEIDSQTWAVAEITERSHAGGAARLRITRQARKTQSTPGARLTGASGGASGLPGGGGGT